MKKLSVVILLWLAVILLLAVAQPHHLPDDMFNNLSEATVEMWVKWGMFQIPLKIC